MAEQDIQTLIWGIEAGVQFSQYPADFQAKVRPLLSAEDIARMETQPLLTSVINNLTGLLPPQVQQAAGYFAQFRSMLVNPQMSYSQLEQYAVRTGVPPIGPGSRDYPVGPWAYARNGFYIREVGHDGYQRTTMDILLPPPYSLHTDANGRVLQLTDGGEQLSITYGGSPATFNAVNPAGDAIQHVSLRLLPGQTLPFSAAQPVAPSSVNWQAKLGQVESYGTAIGHTISLSSPAGRDLQALTRLLSSLSFATGASAGGGTFLASAGATPLAGYAAAGQLALNAWVAAAAAALGQYNPAAAGAAGLSADPRLDLAGYVESPANTSMQRLAIGSPEPGQGSGAAPCASTVTASLNGTRTYSFPLPSATQWYDTGIDLPAGQPVTITATGSIAIGDWQYNIESPTGQPLMQGQQMYMGPFLVPDLPYWSLIGRIAS
ncbi:MAG: hypothetical protein B7X11_03330, partial [Acidobacteria bacterium 37-65-4]